MAAFSQEAGRVSAYEHRPVALGRRGEVPDLQEGKPGRERPDRERARSGNRGADQKAPD